MKMALIKPYWQVSIFKETPANTPYSPALLVLFNFFFLCLVVIQWSIADIENTASIGIAFLTAFSLLGSYALYTFLALKILHHTERFVQTLTCLVAGHTIVHLVATPLLFLLPWLTQDGLNSALALFVGIVYLVLTLLLTIWQFMVSVHIYKHALAMEYLPAIMVSFGLLACNMLVVALWQ